MRSIYQVLAILAITSALSLKPLPSLIADETVASDLRVLAQETWRRFLVVFKARSSCFGDVQLHTDRNLRSRAAYDPDTATVTVRVPATAAMLRGALIHEWAHHIEHQCGSQKQLRAAFLAAQGLPGDTPWKVDYLPTGISQRDWARIPSEQYAEGTIELVLGSRQIPTTAHVRAEAVHVIAEWAAGN
jgi:hypothetical protein